MPTAFPRDVAVLLLFLPAAVSFAGPPAGLGVVEKDGTLQLAPDLKV